MLLNCGVGEDSWESLRLQGDQISQSYRKSVLNIHWKDWCWSWNFNTLAPWCKELTHWKRSWCWERLKAGGEGDNREWDGYMTSLGQWTRVWASSGSWWWTGKPGVLQSKDHRVGHKWAAELNWSQVIDFAFAIKKAEHQRTDAFKLLCWRRLLRVSWTPRNWFKPVNPKGNQLWTFIGKTNAEAPILW